MVDPRDVIADFLLSQGAPEAGVYDLVDGIERVLNVAGYEITVSEHSDGTARDA